MCENRGMLGGLTRAGELCRGCRWSLSPLLGPIPHTGRRNREKIPQEVHFLGKGDTVTDVAVDS